MINEIKTQVVIIGSGPAGYSAAFRCADLGLETVIVEQYNKLGGVCLNVGCIPSKALLHVAKVIEETKLLSKNGIILGDFSVNIDQIRTWKEKIVSYLNTNLVSMAKDRKINVIKGYGKFYNKNVLEVNSENGKLIINFDYAIIATGSRSTKIPLIPYDNSRIWYSTDALELKSIPKQMLIIGGGIIGLEMGIIYHALGSRIDIVESFNQVIPPADEDIIKIFTKSINKKFNLMLEAKVHSYELKEDGIYVSIENKENSFLLRRYDVILVAIGRKPNIYDIEINKINIEIKNDGFIKVDNQLRTNISNIFAIGDVTGQPMLAHKSVHEGHVAAEVIAGMKHYFEPKVIPCVAYTEPELAWVGLTEKEAKKRGIKYKISTFPWNASGRAIASNHIDGMTKLIFDKETSQIIGGSVVGVNGGEIIGEIGLAIEMGCNAEDIALTIHAHPTFYESIGLAAEVFEGTITDLPKNKLNR